MMTLTTTTFTALYATRLQSLSPINLHTFSQMAIRDWIKLTVNPSIVRSNAIIYAYSFCIDCRNMF
jgi:hypothetical protein